MEGERKDFFVSHAGADRAWAEWVAWQLTDAGYTVELDVWDWAAGQNFMTAMSDALDRCDRVVALFSAAYFERERYTTDEWTAVALHAPGSGEGRLVPLRVEDVPTTQIPAVLRPLQFRDLFGIDEEHARRRVLRAVADPRRPDHQPAFPGRGKPGDLSRLGGVGPRLPGSVPRVWNIPARNPGFTGRDGLLVAVRERLLTGDRAVVQAFEGMGGVGKTQLAIEYAHRFAGTYGLVWWVDSEQPGLIGDQFAALGAELRCVEPGAAAEAVRSAVLGELRERGGWLLVFDNAECPAGIRSWLPGGSGHVLITSRERNWAQIAVPVEVDVLARAESVAILQGRVPGLVAADAGRLADELGDLPLAVAQAAGFMAETGMPAAEYLGLLRTRAGHLLDQVPAGADYPRSLAAATQLTADRLTADDPAAAELASLCTFLAPEPIPEDLFTGAAGELPRDLAERAADPLAWRQTLAHLARQSLARIDQRGLTMHRLIQAILRDRLTPAQVTAARQCSEAILVASDPHDPGDPVTWPRWAALAIDLRRLGEVQAARDLHRDTLDRTRRILGDDHPDTLASANNLAVCLLELGEVQAARDLDQDTLDRKRRVLGENHPETLRSARNLAADLRALEEAGEA